MSQYVLELLDATRDRKAFESGVDTIDSYLKETARGHTDKGVSLTRVLINPDAAPQKNILGYFTLTPCMVEAAGRPAVQKGLPRNTAGAVLLGRLGVAKSLQGAGIGTRLLALARRITFDSLSATDATDGIGMVVDAATDELIAFHEKFGFRRVSSKALRLFLPTRSLVDKTED